MDGPSIGVGAENDTCILAEKAHLPRVLATLHASLEVGAPMALSFPASPWTEPELADLATGSGWAEVSTAPYTSGGFSTIQLRGSRARSLADSVGPAMRLLVCGLNPSLYAADAGVGFARPGNRFWKAALTAGVLSRPLDPWHALDVHAVGMTDLVKRATAGAAELRADEYKSGFARVDRLCSSFRPDAIVFVGLDGWRRAVDRQATTGWQDAKVGGRPAYVMPSTSGRNASATLDGLVAHLRAALEPTRRA